MTINAKKTTKHRRPSFHEQRDLAWDWQLDKPSLLRSTTDFIWELVKVIVISLAIILPVRYYLIQPFYVKGALMEPNFYDHEYLIIDEISYRLREPQRGDIVVFKYPRDPRQYFIKRIIGLPGETVRVHEGKVSITVKNETESRVLDESRYLLTETFTPGETTKILGESEYFVMGDNRSSSLDSRNFGAVDRELIVGRTWLRGWPFDKIKTFNAVDCNF